MKFFLFIVIASLLSSAGVLSQYPKPTQYVITDSTQVKTVWKKTFIGAKAITKYVQLINLDSTNNLWYCWQRADTATASKIVRLPPLTTDPNSQGIVNRDTIWTRAAADSIKYLLISKLASQ